MSELSEERSAVIRVVVIDDHPIVSFGLRRVFERQGIDIVGDARTGAEGIELALRLRPDVVLMDVMLPDMRGADATRRILEALPDLQVLAFSGYTDPLLVHEMLGAGACGYALKAHREDELIRALRAVAGGEVFLSGSLLLPLAQFAASAAQEPLSARETEILRRLANGEAPREIAGHLGLSLRTVQAVRAQIIAKLRVKNTAGLVRYALRAGLADLPPDGA